MIFVAFVCFAVLASESLGQVGQSFKGADLPEDFCKKCWERRGQVEYAQNPANCSEYFHCFRNRSGIEGILMPCAKGLRFDDSIQACVPMLDPEADPTDPANCQDPCSDPTTMMIGYWIPPGECGLFYKCSNYYSLKMCCPEKQSFNITWGDCMPNKTCIGHEKECEQKVTVGMMTPQIIDNVTCWDPQYKVKRQLKPDNPHEYVVILDPMTSIDMICPPGTAFELHTCKCTNFTLWEVTYAPFEDCLVDIDFNNKTIIDNSMNKFWVDNSDPRSLVQILVHPGDLIGYGGFDGMSYFELPGMQGNALRDRVTIMFWVKWDCADADTVGGILSNRGEKNVAPSVFIWKDVENIIRAGFRTNKATLELDETLICDKWFHVALVFDRDWMGLYVNCNLRKQVETEKGFIYWMMHCPLAVGHDQEKGFFKGCLDDLLICREVFTRDEICARMNNPQIVPADTATLGPANP